MSGLPIPVNISGESIVYKEDGSVDTVYGTKFKTVDEAEGRLQKHVAFILKQQVDAEKTGFVTLHNGRKCPVTQAYKCYYCLQYIGEEEAIKHFAMSRKAYYSGGL